MKRIKLTKGQYTLVDDQDYARLSKYKCQLVNSTEGKYYASVKIDGTNLYLHRFIMGAKKGQIIDHKNGEGLDNQRDNLRVCTHSQNGANRKPSKNGTSEYLGVSLTTIRHKYNYWQAQISINKKIKKLGNFKTEIEAAIIYNIAARKYHGEFARPNKF